jgi:F-type H+-transporting ATPase subunit delta
MKVSKQARHEAKQLYLDCLADGLLEEARVRQVVDLVCSRKPRGYLGMLAHFYRLVRLAVQRRTATIESPAPLPADLQAGVQSNLTRLYGPGLRFAFTANPELIGGLRIQVGSDVFDGSVRGRLQAINESFQEA